MIRDIRNLFDTLEAYEIYADCMYMPTFEKFHARAVEYIKNDAIHIYGYYESSRLTGIIVLEKQSDEQAEIKGIAVNADYRKRGVGEKLIHYSCNELAISVLTAETDDDAVGFYMRCGFVAKGFMKYGEYKRYNCTLTIT